MSGGSHHPWLVVTLVCFFVATTSGAEAQTWLSDRKRAEGSGIRVGDLELHPGIGAELGYLSNVYNDEDGNELGSAALRVAPHLFLSTLTEERGDTEGERVPGFVRFRGGLSASLQHYFADNMPTTDFGANADLRLTLAPERPISFEVVEIFSRMFRPFADPIEDPADGPLPSPDYVRYQETIGARLIGQTRGGLLQGSLGYRFNYNWFQDDAYSQNNNLIHTVQLTGGWEFLPKTALFYEATYAHQDYTENQDSGEDVQRLEDNDQVSSRIGINGAITSRISATLAAGYAAGFFNGNDFEGVTVHVDGRWTPTEISELGLGYERSFTSAYLGNFVQRDQIYTRLRFFVGGSFVIASKLAVEFLQFGPDELSDAEPRDDIRYSGDLSAEYRFVSWLALTGQLSAVIDDTDYVYVLDTPSGDDEDPAEYKSFEAWIGVRAFL